MSADITTSPVRRRRARRPLRRGGLLVVLVVGLMGLTDVLSLIHI